MLIHPIFASYFERLSPESIYLFVGTTSFESEDICSTNIDTSKFFDGRLVCDGSSLAFEFFGQTCSVNAESVKEAMLANTWKQFALPFEKDCKASFLYKNDGVVTFLFFGLGRTGVSDKFNVSGDAWFETNEDGDIIESDAPCIAIGQSVDSLLRFPVWNNPYVSDEPIAIEPVTFEFTKTVAMASKLFVQVMLGEKTGLEAITEMIEAGIHASRAVEALDQYARDKDFSKYLVACHKLGFRPYGGRFSTKSECEDRDKCVRLAIAAISEPEYENLNFLPRHAFKTMAVAANLL